MTKPHALFNPAKISLDDLYLDPSNPRFVDSLRLEGEISDDDVAGRQKDVLDRFRTAAEEESSADDSDESFFGISDLMSSMHQIGFVPIDRVVVRKLTPKKAMKTQKYLVIEGNRRVSAAKKLREQDRLETHPKKKLGPERANSLEKLDVLLLETDGLTPDEIHEKVGVILGLRHYGSVLEWEPMPKAKNIFTEYMGAPPGLAEFALNAARVGGVAMRLSVKRADVIRALKTYVAFKQLSDSFPGAPPQPRHYSLLQALVTNTKLIVAGYLAPDKTTARLTDDALEKVNALCQFETRETMDPEKKVLAEPKSVKAFASLVADAHGNREPAIQGYAKSLLGEVENGSRKLSDAMDDLKLFTSVRQWTEALNDLMKKQKEALPFADFHPSGNDVLRLEEAIKAFRNVRKILDL